jgi:hypothetical protein
MPVFYSYEDIYKNCIACRVFYKLDAQVAPSESVRIGNICFCFRIEKILEDRIECPIEDHKWRAIQNVRNVSMQYIVIDGEFPKRKRSFE